jgi:tetratricopeptide (TPR) repeat protein
VEAAAPDWTCWPPKVEAVIARQLAALPDEDRALLQAASVQGEQFAAEVAARALGWDEEVAVRRLSGPLRTRHRLVEAVSLDRLASSGQRLSRYRFRHGLLQGSAYRGLDAVQQARLHEATGRALEAIYAPAVAGSTAGAAAAEQVPAPDLARHFEAAGLPLEAARYRLEAGRWAVRLVAYDEAIAHLERGLALLESAVTSRERLRLELALCLALVNPAVLQRGFQSPGLQRTLARLFELAQHPDLQDDPQRLTALVLLALANSWSAHPERGQRVGEQLLELVPSASSGQAQESDRQSLMLAHWVLGQSHFVRGQLVSAREHLGQALALHDLEASRPLDLLFPGEPGVAGCAVLGTVLWLMGYPDQGQGNLQRALAQAQEMEQPSSAAFAHIVAGVAYSVLGRDVAAALDHAQALRTIGEAGPFYDVWAEMFSGQGGPAEPEPGLKQGLGQAAEEGTALQAFGAGVGQAAFLLVQAGLLGRADRAGRGLEATDQALAWIEQTRVRILEAEVWRTRGELLLALTPAPLPRVGEGRKSRRASGARCMWLASKGRAGWSYGHR